jgi:hypothetical protein
MEHPLDSLSYRFVSEVFAPVELLQALPDLLAKPCIMVEIMLDKLLNVPVRIAAVFSGYPIQLRLQAGIERYFLPPEDDSVGDVSRGEKRPLKAGGSQDWPPHKAASPQPIRASRFAGDRLGAGPGRRFCQPAPQKLR